MNEQSIMVRDDSKLAISFTPAAESLKSTALESAALIGKVTNADEQLSAVEAAKQITSTLKLAEDARKAVKEPILNYGRAIDDAANKFTTELKDEQMRINRLIGDFQQLEHAKIRAAQQAENDRLSALERERFKAAAQATSHDELDRINKEHGDKVEAAKVPLVMPTRVEGQIVREEWEVQVSDIWLLAKAHPACVKIEPRLSEIKSLLNAGIKVAGVNATKKTTATVRAGRPQAAIEA